MTTFTTHATATFATGNIVVVQSADNMISGLPIVFSGTTFGNVQANATYYIGNITFGYPTSNITLTGLPGGAVVPIGTGTGNMTATFQQGGQIIIPTVAPGEPLNQAFDAINTNFDQVFAAGPVSSNIRIAENTIYTINTNGNLVLNPNGIGNVVANAHVVPDRDRVRNLGGPLLRWNTVYAQNIVANIAGNIVAGGANGQIQYNNNGILAGANGFVYVANTDSVSLAGTLTAGNVQTPGTLTAGNVLSPGIISSAGGIYGDIYTTLIESGDSSAILVLSEVDMQSDLTVGQSLQVNQNISAVGNITASYFFGNGSQLTGVTADNVNADDLVGNTLSANVLFSSLTALGTLTNLSVAGTTTAGNLRTAGSITATGNITGNYFFGNGSQLTGITADNVNADDLVGNILSANVLYSNLITLGNLVSLSVAGNTTTGNLAITGNSLTWANASIVQTSATDFSITGDGQITIRSLDGTYQWTFDDAGNLTAPGNISTSANVSANYFFGNGSQLTGIITSVSNVANGNSNIDIAGAGANITVSVGGVSNTVVFTPDGLSATGNVSANYYFGNGSQLTGITADNVNADDLIGNTLSANVLFSSLTTVGTLTDLAVTGSATAGNVLTAGVVSAAGNVRGNNVNTDGVVTAAGTITGGNIVTAGNVTGTFIIGDGSQLTNLPAGDYSNANVAAYLPTYTGNLTANIISATGNITGNYIFGNGSQLTGIITSVSNVINGNSNIDIATPGANITVSVDGVSNTVVFTPAGISAVGNITGNFFIGNGSQLTGITADAVNADDLLGNTLSSNVLFSSLTTVGTLANLSVTGDVTGGNLVTAGSITATGNITGGNVNTGSLYSAGELIITANASGVLFNTTGNVDVSNVHINNLADPLQAQDAATKAYVDSVAEGLVIDAPVAAATPATLATISGGIVTYNNGNAGVGSTLDTTGTYTLIDGYNIATVGTRILVKDEANLAHNGIYTYANSTALIRSTDYNQPSEITGHDFVFVQYGNIYAGTGWVNIDAVTTVGTDPIEWIQFSGAGTIQAGNGIAVNGTQINVLTDGITTGINGSNQVEVIPNAQLTTPNIGAATGASLSVTGNITSDTFVTGNKIIPATGNVNVANVNINNVVDPVQAQDAATKAYVDNNLANVSANILGNLINMGSNTQGQLVSNAVTLTTTTKVTDGIALLNQVLGKLVPPAPPTFPAGQTLSLTGVSTFRMANITQVNNTANSLTVAAGATVTRVRRAATYSTNTITTAGPGDAGTIIGLRNGTGVGNTTFNPAATPSANGTYGGNLIITNNMDYNSANASIAAGFWYVFSAAMSGSGAPAGWNDLVMTQSAAGTSNVVSWYYDISSPATPSFAGTSMTVAANTVTFSSTIPHYTSATQFAIGATVANVSGNMYPTSNTLASGTAGGSFAAPASVNYNASNIGSNILNAFQSASFTTTANVTTGFGGSNVGPTMTVDNSYSTGTLTLTTALGNIVLRKTGNATAIDEGNIVITTVGTGSGNGVRIINPGSGNTPVYTANAATFNSQSSTLQTNDATVVGSGSQGVLRHDQTNYSTGYLPVGPNLSVGRSGTQYFTFKFTRTDVSKFDITYAGNVAGMWVALPGSVIDASSGANGWINMAVAYAGAGYPGANAPGNGSDGCALGGVVQLNTTVASTSRTCTFGTVSSSSTATNEIYVRIALTSGQTVTGLSLKAASN